MYSSNSHRRPISAGHYAKNHRRPHSVENRSRNVESTMRALDDGSCQPVNYSGTQVNIFGNPNADALSNILGNAPGGNLMGGGAGTYPYGPTYPPAGFTQNVQLGLMTDHMLRKLDESRMFTVTELMRRAYGPQQPFVQEPPSPREAIEYRPKAKNFSPGNGDWKGQVEHIYAHLLEVGSEDKQFRINMGEPRLGELIQADLEEDDYSYTLKLGFAKQKDTSRETVEYERPIRQASPKKSVTIVDSYKKKPESKVKQEIEKEPQYEKENYKQEGTLKPYKNFSAETDAEVLRKAMKGLGTDENAIINVLAKRSNKQRQDIIKQYKTMFGKDLLKDLKSELSGELSQVIKALSLPPADYDATELRNAIKGLGTNDSTLIEIICTRTNKSLKLIQESYKRLYNKNLEEDIIDDTSGNYQRLLVALLQANRDESDSVDKHNARKDAQMLYEAGAKRWGTDESRFNAILVSRSYPQLRAIFREYEKIANKSVEESMKGELSGDLAEGMIAIVQCVQNKNAFFAKRLYKSMKGAGTDDATLIRVVVSRCEVDMVQIKEEFQKSYKQTLGQFIADDTSGDYAAVLLALLGESSLSKKEKSSSGRHSSSRRQADDSDD